MTPRALVTGATGMLGSYIAEVLLEQGWQVRALVRSRDRAGWLEDAGVELNHGSLEDRTALIDAAGSCNAVFNAAAMIGSGGNWSDFRRTNIEGVRNVIDAARAARARLVHVSSTAVYGQARYFDEATHEGHPLPVLPKHDVYGRSKQDGERLVLDANRSGGVWASVVRPPVMYGLRDRQFIPRIGPVFERGLFPLIAGGRSHMSLVHARHVAEGAVLAGMTDAAEGRVYLLTNDFPVTAADLTRFAASGLGRRIRTPSIAPAVARAGFAGLGLAVRAIGRTDLARHTRGTLRMFTVDDPFTSERARSELGWAPSIPPEVGIPDAFRSWRNGRAPTTGVEV